MQRWPDGARLGELARLVGGELVGDPDRVVNRIAPLASAGPHDLTFVAKAERRGELLATAAGCVVVPPALREAAIGDAVALAAGASVADAPDGACAPVSPPRAVIICDDPYVAYARLSQWWAARLRPPVAAGIDPRAVVEDGARIDATAHVAALAFVGRGALIGAGAVVGVQAHVGRDAVLGDGSRLLPRATLLDGCSIGRACLVHAGAVIGADGFGFAPHQAQWVKIEQLGAVRIGDFVEIGANTCIDRGALDDTVVGDGVKLDNQIQIGHNVVIGAHSALAGCVGVAGSARIGRRCTAGGGAMILGHLEIVDDVHISAATVVSRSIRRAGHYSGFFPIDDNAAWEKNAATLRQLFALRERLRALEKKDAARR